jgi:DNA-binding NarL/FixJ family response regulator
MATPPARMSKQIGVVVVDDHPLYRAGLVSTIDSSGRAVVVAEASNGREGIDAARSSEADVILMDLHMPEMNGLEAIRQLRREGSKAAILVLTMIGDDDSLRAALAAGANGYLLKEADRSEIMRAIESLAAGEAVFGAGVAERVLSSAGRTAPRRPSIDGVSELTDRECDVLRLLAGGLTNSAIAGRLFLSEKTVRNYVSALFTKLGVTDRAAAVAKARDAGFGKDLPSLGGSEMDR